MTEVPSPLDNDDAREQTPARQDVDVLLDVSELEVDRIKLSVRNLRAHVSVLAELASLLSLQIGVDARLQETELEIEGVRAKLLLKVRLDDIRAVLREALQTVAEHPQILRILTQAVEEVVRGRLGDALGTLENVLEGLEVGEPLGELPKGRLEDVRDTLQEVLGQLGEQAEEEGDERTAVPESPSSTGEAPEDLAKEEREG